MKRTMLAVLLASAVTLVFPAVSQAGCGDDELSSAGQNADTASMTAVLESANQAFQTGKLE